MNAEAEAGFDSSVLIKQLQLPDNFKAVVSNVYLPLCRIIMEKKQAQPLLVSINGAQGTGKSTMTRFLKLVIKATASCQVAELSLDDFYLTRKERLALAGKVHPLLETRGVPGTHDVGLMEFVLERLMRQQPCSSPRFDKAVDDRVDKGEWQVHTKPVDIILFEGWCNNSPAQSAEELKVAINELEEKEDAQGVWRHYVNEQLIDYQQRIYTQADMCIMLQAADFSCVYQWRNLQERKLQANTLAGNKQGIMGERALKRFIQHFERISRHSIKYLPALADVVLPVAVDHSISGLKIKPEKHLPL